MFDPPFADLGGSALEGLRRAMARLAADAVVVAVQFSRVASVAQVDRVRRGAGWWRWCRSTDRSDWQRGQYPERGAGQGFTRALLFRA